MAVDEPYLILASRSPRRVQLLRQAKVPFAIDPADIDESLVPAELSPAQLSEHLARSKAFHVAKRHPGAYVLGADTVVAVGSELLGKPVDLSDAERMIELLMGSTHEVITGVSLISPDGRDQTGHVVTRVTMRTLTEDEIGNHLASENWLGKAGGYGLQDGDPFITSVEGDRENVVGLPMAYTLELLRSVGLAKGGV